MPVRVMPLRACHPPFKPRAFLHPIGFFRSARHAGQYLGQRPAEGSKENSLLQRRQALVTVSAGECFALHAWQYVGQYWTSSGSSIVFPQC
jgi:hypothetical protein